MNRKTYKKVRKQADILLLNWVRSLVSDEEKEKISKENMDSFLPAKDYFSTDKGNRVSFYTRRWTIKTIKQLVQEGHDISQISMRDLESKQKRN